MRYQRLDLNLLVALKQLLTDKSVTRAAQAVHVTQPAMSGILSRLREYFDDPLILQVGRKMELTPLGQSLVEPVSDLLVRIDATLDTRAGFDPATTQRRFSIVASDYVVQVLLADVLKRVHAQAPRVRIDLRQPGLESALQLEEGEVDLLITPEAMGAASQVATALFEDGFFALVDRDTTAVGEGLTLEQYLAQRHVVFESQGKPFFDRWFDRTHGEIRRIEVSAHGFQALPVLVAGTSRVATLPARLARQLTATLPVRTVRLNFAVPRLVEVLQWHKVRELDPGLQWLRHQITEQAAILPPVAPDAC